MQAIYEEDEMTIYSNIDDISSRDVCRGTEDTTRNQTSQHIGCKSLMNRSLRSVLVCLVVLCVLLLTAVIVLFVLIYTNNHQFHINYKNITQHRDQLLTKYTNITQDRDQLVTNNINLTEERDQLLTKYTNITEERDQLLTKYTNITEERDQLLTKYTNITEERDQLLTKYTNITEERDQLLTKYTNITEERDQLLTKYTNITEERDQINEKIHKLWKILNETDGWLYKQPSFYFISSEKKSWSESRRYCREKNSDLIIINSKQEQEFAVKAIGNNGVWIGLSDSAVEGTWKWLDGSTLTYRFWRSGEPNSYAGDEDCAVSFSSGWDDYPCDRPHKWICERNILK